VSTQEHRFEPMTVGMVLDKSFRLYVQNFPLMIGISAIFSVPMLALSLIVLAPPFVASGTANALLFATSVLIGALVSIVGFVIVYPLTIGATTKAVSERYLGNAVTIRSALREAWGSIGTLLLNQLVVGIIVAVGFILLIVPGVLWLLSYSLIVPVAILETRARSLSVTGAPMPLQTLDRAQIRRRSWDLVQGNRGKVFLVLIVFVILGLLLRSATGFVVGLGVDRTSPMYFVLDSIIGNVIEVLSYPLQTIAITLLYYDIRIRKEGFDLEMLSHAIGSPPVNA
jgi:hypothetical protein